MWLDVWAPQLTTNEPEEVLTTIRPLPVPTPEAVEAKRKTLPQGEIGADPVSALLIDLDRHIQDVVNVLRYEDLTGVVLVVWSYGVMIVAGAADRAPNGSRTSST